MPEMIERSAPVRQATFARSSFCWIGNEPAGRNQFVSFERSFDLAAKAPARIHLFADTRYRLWVNDRFVAYGPGRFVTTWPEYDTHDLTGLLEPGANRIRVEVNFYGASSYQTMPDGQPGFLADGGVDGTDIGFETPGDWLARIHRAWDARAPLFSFAQNPAEICDTRLLAAELDEPAELPLCTIGPNAGPWPKPLPRSVPYPDYEIVRPVRIIATGPLAETRRVGLRLNGYPRRVILRQNPRKSIAFLTWLYSPQSQTILLESFWTGLELNGECLPASDSRRLGNHSESSARLRQGWNFLAGRFELLLESQSLLLGLPTDCGVTLHALPDRGCAEQFAVSEPLDNPPIPPCPSDPASYQTPQGWSHAASDLSQITPARLIAWDQPISDAVIRNIPYGALSEASVHHASAAMWTFDFNGEYYGQPVIEVEAPAGSVLDVAYDDWLRDDGCVNLYGSNPLAETADRFVLRGGRQRIDVLNPRGGSYLQLILRVPEFAPAAALHIHSLGIRRRTLLNTVTGSFACGDPLIDWAWETSISTLQASTDEAYCDCPWRERGTYVGDSLVCLQLQRLITADLSIARRTLANFGRAQRSNGQIPACAPSWKPDALEDFTLLWILCVRDYWALTGDRAFVSDQWPVIQRIWQSQAWSADADGLWDATGLHVFVDWGVLTSEREGPGNGVINILRVAAANACAELAAALGAPEEHARFHCEAATVATALQRRLWNESEGRFDASIGASTPALHANILALRYGVGPARRLLAYLEPRLRANFVTGLEGGNHSGHAELYYFHFLLPALAAYGRTQLAEDLIREHYGYLRSLGRRTLMECFSRAHESRGSCCHAWSGTPAVFASGFILGLRQQTPGDPDHWLLDPQCPEHDHACGKLPHERGIIEVNWERCGASVRATATAPPGVEIHAAAHVNLTLSTRT